MQKGGEIMIKCGFRGDCRCLDGLGNCFFGGSCVYKCPNNKNPPCENKTVKMCCKTFLKKNINLIENKNLTLYNAR